MSISGYIYCIVDQSERRKLGFAKDADIRIDTLQTGNAERLTIEYRMEVKNMLRAETSIHQIFAADIIRTDGEWYKIKDMELLRKIFRSIDTTQKEEQLLESLGLR